MENPSWPLMLNFNTGYCKLFAALLPPAKEVWGKVMFLHLSVNLFTELVYPSK